LRLRPPKALHRGAGSGAPGELSSLDTVTRRAWHELYVYLSGVHSLSVKEFNSGSSPVGISVTDHLQNMLDEASFAFLILTGDDRRTEICTRV
jgi:hypothetical protein